MCDDMSLSLSVCKYVILVLLSYLFEDLTVMPLNHLSTSNPVTHSLGNPFLLRGSIAKPLK